MHTCGQTDIGQDHAAGMQVGDIVSNKTNFQNILSHFELATGKVAAIKVLRTLIAL